MPHSSGGGSHSGGSHGGSHGSRSHGGGSSGPRYSSRPFARCRRFRYYDRNGMDRYVYCDREPKPMSVIALIFSLVFMLPFMGFGGLMIIFAASEILPQQPLIQPYGCSGEHIRDNARIIDNMAELEKSLAAFEETTGICPLLMTDYNSSWEGKYDSLENYAYDVYVNSFEDETHFLVIYTEPENASGLDFNNWYWEGMQGNATDSILSERNFSIFREDLQKYLTKESVSVGEAFRIAFDNTESYIMKGGGDKPTLIFMGLFSLIWNGFVLIFICSTISGFIKSRRDYVEVPMDEMSSVDNGFFS